MLCFSGYLSVLHCLFIATYLQPSVRIPTLGDGHWMDNGSRAHVFHSPILLLASFHTTREIETGGSHTNI